MVFKVHAYVDDQLLETFAKTANEAFAKAVEWHVVGRLEDITISDENRNYSIVEFASVMALAEIANIQFQFCRDHTTNVFPINRNSNAKRSARNIE